MAVNHVGALNAVDATVARNTHVSCRQTTSSKSEVSYHACLAPTSGGIIRTVDTLAAAADVVLSRFQIQRCVIDTTGGVSVAFARTTMMAMYQITRSKWFVIVER